MDVDVQECAGVRSAADTPALPLLMLVLLSFSISVCWFLYWYCVDCWLLEELPVVLMPMPADDGTLCALDVLLTVCARASSCATSQLI
jgi:hypothetical protein